MMYLVTRELRSGDSRRRATLSAVVAPDIGSPDGEARSKLNLAVANLVY